MWKAVIAVGLFGFLHPLSKPFFLAGLEADFFALFFVLLRALMTIPLVNWHKFSGLCRRHVKPILGMGAAAAALQLSEFHAIQVGVPVSVVSFLIFTLPLWAVVFGKLINNERPNQGQVVHALMVMVGGILIAFGMDGLPALKSQLIWPVTAGMALGLWVSLSRLLRLDGIQASLLSVICDAVSLVLIFGFVVMRHDSADWYRAVSWVFEYRNFLALLAYTFFLGLVANLLFYGAAQAMSANHLSLVMTFEPVVSSILSYALYHEFLAPIQIVGTALILVTHLPYSRLYEMTQAKPVSVK